MRGPQRGPHLLRYHLRDGQSVPLAEIVEETHGMVLDHEAVRGESLLHLVDPTFHHLATTTGTQVLHRGGGRGWLAGQE